MLYLWGQKVKGQGQKVTFSSKMLGSPNLVGKFILMFPGLELILGSKGQKVKGQGQGQRVNFPPKTAAARITKFKFICTFPGLTLILGSVKWSKG